VAKVFVAVGGVAKKIASYYRLSAASSEKNELRAIPLPSPHFTFAP
jgi:hypothetical protein